MSAGTTALRADAPRAFPSALPVAAMTLAVCSWGFGNVLVKLTSLDGMAISFYRLWLGALVMFIVLRLAGGRLTWLQLRQAAPAGLIFGANVALFFSALKLTNVVNASLIQALQPAVVLVVAGPLFCERVTRRAVAWTAVSIAGVAMVIVGAAGTPEWSPLGDALAAASMVLFTAYFVLSKRVRETVGTLEYMAAVQITAAIVVAPLGIVSYREVVSIHGADWLWIAIFVLVTGLSAHILINWAHPYVEISLSSVLVLLTPVVATAAAWVILDESLTLLQIAGGIVALSGILAIVRRPGAPARASEILAPEH